MPATMHAVRPRSIRPMNKESRCLYIPLEDAPVLSSFAERAHVVNCRASLRIFFSLATERCHNTELQLHVRSNQPCHHELPHSSLVSHNCWRQRRQRLMLWARAAGKTAGHRNFIATSRRRQCWRRFSLSGCRVCLRTREMRLQAAAAFLAPRPVAARRPILAGTRW